MTRSIFSFIGIVAALALFFMYTKATYDATQKTNAQIAQYDAALVKAKELKTRKDELLTIYKSFSPDDLDRLQKMLPDHVDNVRLILDLDSIASHRGMALQNVTVSTPGEGATTQSAIGTISSTQQKYDTLTTSFSSQGTYQSLLQLVGDLESSLRIMDISSLKITPGGDVAGGDSLYTLQISLRTYWLK